MEINKIALFEGKKIRKIIYKKECFFSIVDIVDVLTESKNPTDYLKKLRKRDNEIGLYLGTNCPHVEMVTSTGKKRKTLAGNVEQILRIIQSIPSKKAEPFKLWLARVGKERIDEIQNPEIAMDRMKILYEQKGYSKDWIDKRARGIAIRHTLTDEWKNRGASRNIDFAILTNEIMKSTFGLTVSEYKKIKNLNKENLRDHMDDIELILNMLGEASTTKFTQDRNSNGFTRLKKDANDGGHVAKVARTEIENQSKKSIISNKNYLDQRLEKQIK